MHPEQHDIVNFMEKGRVKKKKSIKKAKMYNLDFNTILTIWQKNA